MTLQIASGQCNLMTENVGECEMLKQRDNIGEPFVKGAHIGVRCVQESPMHAVKEGMRCFVRDNIVGQAGEYHPSRDVIAWIVFGGSEVAE